MTEIKIGGRTIPLMLTCMEMPMIQEEIGCTAAQMRTEVFGIQMNEETGDYEIHMMEDSGKIRKLGVLLRIMGNAGLEEAGKEPDLTDKWVLRRMKPGMALAFAIVAMTVVNEAMSMETAEEAEKGPVDEILREENAKKEPGK